MSTRTAEIAAQAREAGYQLEQIEQVRHNRWILVLREDAETRILALVQQRPLISAADVQDLAELLALGHYSYGLLIALEGRFSPVAHRTASELAKTRIILCHGFPAPPHAPRMQTALEPLQ